MATGNLPAQLTPFVGRTDEIAAIVDRLDDPHCRVLTLVGPGGIGKTRLAIEVASRQLHLFPEGVYFVGLQPIASIDHIIPTIASATGFEFHDGRNPTAQLLHYLHEQCLLLILDNFEHLLPESDVVMELLNGAPKLKLLITSRVALNLREEWLFHVDGMSYPQDESTDILEAYSAVKLFVERAQRARHDFSLADEAPHVVRVCQLVDGMPLGLELAATWLRRMPCPAIAEEIQHSLDFLATDLGGIPDRHRSMRAVFDHSWKLLNAEERSVLMGLSVFRGGFQREAAEQVAGASLHILSTLVDKSMLRVRSDGRYEIHELQRQYAEEKLIEKPEEEVTFRNRHCAYYAEFMSRPVLDFVSAGNNATLKAIDSDIDNVRAAWKWGVEHKRANDLFKAEQGLYWYAWMRNWHQEGEQCFREAVASLREVAPASKNEVALGTILLSLGSMNIWLGQLPQAKEYLQESVVMLRRLDARRELGLAIGVLGWAAYAQQDWDTAKALLLEAAGLEEETGQHENQGFMLNMLGAIACTLGQYAESEGWHQQALRLGRKIGDQRTIAESHGQLGKIALVLGEFVKAQRFFERSLAVARTHDLRVFTTGALNRLGEVAEATGELDEAERYLCESLAIAQGYGKPQTIAATLAGLAHVMVSQGEYQAAREHYHEAGEIAVDTDNHPLLADVHAGLGHVALHSGDYLDAQDCYTASLEHYQQTGNRPGTAKILAGLGLVALAQGDHVQARQHFLESLQDGIAAGSPPVILNTVMGIAELLKSQGDLATVLRLATLIINHPASTAETKKRAEVILTCLGAKMPAADLGKSIQQTASDSLDVEAVALVEQLESLIHQSLVEPLSERELEVLRLVAAGKSNREIARDLTLALGTVKSHLHNIMQKLDAESRTEAIMQARSLRLL